MKTIVLAAALLTAATAPALAANDFSGVWNSHWEAAGGAKPGNARVIVTQSVFDKSEFDGMYDNPGYNALMTGHVKGANWNGVWMVPGGGGAGTFAFKLGADGKSWTGTWTVNGETAAWNGTKVGNLP